MSCDTATPAPESLLLITVDTLRADHLGSYGDPRGLTPRLDALAANSERFTTVYTTTPFTLPAVAGLLTGRLPERLGLTSNLGRLPRDVPTLATALRDAGFATGAVVGNPVLAPRTRLARGFEHYDAEVKQREAIRGVPERTARATTDAAIAMLESLTETPGPFFLWVHYQDPHGPYAPPPPYRTRFVGDALARKDGHRMLPQHRDERGTGGIPFYQGLDGRRDAGFYRGRYAGEVAYVDAEIDRLLDRLRERGRAERTAIVFTADHGEGLGEQDYWFAHGQLVNEPSVRVPLLIHVPGRRPRVRSEPASLVDLHPTVLGIFGLPPEPGLDGVDLLAGPVAPRDLYVATQSKRAGTRSDAVVSAGYKLVRHTDASGTREQLFHLPDEQTDLAGQEPELVHDLADRLDALIPNVGARASESLRPSAEERAALRSLGYLAPAAPDIVLVTLDTLRVDHLDAYGGSLALTPNLDALASRGLLFENAFTTMPTTGPAHASLFTGRMPHEHGVVRNGMRLPKRLAPTQLAVRLRNQGYETGAFVSSAALARRLTRLQAFAVYDRPQESHRSGRRTVARALDWLREQTQRPVFLWVHLYDPHAPYGSEARRQRERTVDQSQHGWVSGSRHATLRARIAMAIRYGQGVHDLDRAFGLLVTGVEAALESPVWLAVSDHGESLHEHLETRGYGYDHGEFLDDEQIRIALLLAGPDIATGRVRTAVSIRDIYTTLLGVAGIADTEAASAGRLDLRSLAPGESGSRWVRASRRALRKGEAAALGPKAALVRAHRVVATDGTRAVILGEDGRILRTEGEADPDGLATARAHLAAARGAVADASRHALDEETRAELEALGYVR